MTVTILHVAAVMFSVTAFTTLYLVYTELLELREGMEELVGGARLGEVDKVMVDGTACLLGTGRKRSKQCWADMRHELWARGMTPKKRQRKEKKKKKKRGLRGERRGGGPRRVLGLH
jgi:hypothetical protein